jgi:outer membrane protein, multidrug efflux system
MGIFVVLMIIVLAAGCMVGPDYFHLNVDVPAGYRFEDKETRDATYTLWWRQFQNPELDALIIESLSNNKNIQVASTNVGKAAGVLTQTRSPLFPQIDYSGSGTKQRGSEQDATPIPASVANPQTT